MGKQVMSNEGNETKECIVTVHHLMREHFVKHIRFGLMSRDFFVNKVYVSKILPIEQSMKISLFFIDPSTEIGFNMDRRHKVVYVNNGTEVEAMRLRMEKYKNAKVIQYTLGMSSKYQQIDNTYEAITNNNLMHGVATMNNTKNEFVSAMFDRKYHILRMDIGGSGNMKQQGWNVNYLSNRQLQYKNDAGEWTLWRKDIILKQDEILVVDVDISTTAMRVFDDTQGHIAIGCLRFYGHVV